MYFYMQTPNLPLKVGKNICIIDFYLSEQKRCYFEKRAEYTFPLIIPADHIALKAQFH